MKTLRLHTLASACALLLGTLGPVLLPHSLAHAYSAWQEGSTYSAGTRITFDGRDYEALITHTAFVGANWNPAATPTLWRELGPTGNATPTPVPAPTPTQSPTPTPTPTPTNPGAPQWSPSQTYYSGNEVCHNGVLYRARWWVQGESPDPNTQWGPWQQVGTCPTYPPPYQPAPAQTPTPSPLPEPTPVITPPPPLPTPQPAPAAAPIEWAFNPMGLNVADIAFTLNEADTAFTPTYWALLGPDNRRYPLSNPSVQRAGQSGAYYYGGVAVASELVDATPAGYRVLVCRDEQADAPCHVSHERGFIGMPAPTPTPPGYVQPPVPVPPQPLPAGPTRAISWLLDPVAYLPHQAIIAWSADATTLGLTPATWHLERVDVPATAFSGNWLMWSHADPQSQQLIHGGTSRTPLAAGIYRLKVCSADYVQCVASESQLAFFGTTP